MHNLKRMSTPKVAVLAAGLTAAVLVAMLGPSAAQATPTKQANCTGCHGSGAVSGTVSAKPSTVTLAAGAAYTVLVTPPGNPGRRQHRVLDRQLGRGRHHRHDHGRDRRTRRISDLHGGYESPRNGRYLLAGHLDVDRAYSLAVDRARLVPDDPGQSLRNLWCREVRDGHRHGVFLDQQDDRRPGAAPVPLPERLCDCHPDGRRRIQRREVPPGFATQLRSERVGATP
jgi:hypothetical protein